MFVCIFVRHVHVCCTCLRYVYVYGMFMVFYGIPMVFYGILMVFDCILWYLRKLTDVKGDCMDYKGK